MEKSSPRTLRDAVIVALIVGSMSLASAWIVSGRVHEYKMEVDSKMDLLLKLNHADGYRQGEAAGVQSERDYQNDQERKDDASKLRGPEGPRGPRGPKGKQ